MRHSRHSQPPPGLAQSPPEQPPPGKFQPGHATLMATPAAQRRRDWATTAGSGFWKNLRGGFRPSMATIWPFKFNHLGILDVRFYHERTFAIL